MALQKAFNPTRPSATLQARFASLPPVRDPMLLTPLELTLLALIVGAVCGSFLNVCIYRLPEGHSVVHPGSRCPSCGAAIRWYHNIPILGWVMLRGRCADCGDAISIQYPLVELAGALVAWTTLLHLGPSLETVAFALLGLAFIALAMIDFRHYILPDVITLPGILAGLIAAALLGPGQALPDLESSAWGAAAGGGGLWLFAWLFQRVTGKAGMGLGDVKLLALIGAWLGWAALPFTLFASALLGSVVGLGWILLLGRDRHLPIPFGPYLIAAAWIYLYQGPQVYAWYWQTVLGL
ncbi:MAG: prepilin peptidase [Magnetococcus sp. WYHC-3]